MPENKRIIRAGSFPLYEIVQSTDRLSVTIRESNNVRSKFLVRSFQ